MTFQATATYSVEDNKLRLYASERLDDDIYQRVKEAGFRWAPKQELFVAPKWTPEREDLCIELAGEITAEDSTMLERAEAKSERLTDLAVKREQQGNAYADAARAISKRFEFGQPILVGHHSERKARKDQERMDSHMKKASSSFNSIDYWNYRAAGVLSFANRKHNPRTVANRIKTLGKSFRDFQTRLNHAHLCIRLWTKIQNTSEDAAFLKGFNTYHGARLATGSACPFAWEQFSEEEALEKARALVPKIIERWTEISQSEYYARWLHHILNRLAYERAEQGITTRYSDEITAPVLQAFARDQGALKPKATLVGTTWTITSPVPFPAHVAEGESVEGDAEFYRDLMQSIGYVVPEKKERRRSTSTSVPLINPSFEEAQLLQAKWNAEAQASVTRKGNHYGEFRMRAVAQMSQANYKARSGGSYTPCSTIELDADGQRVWTNYKGKSAEPVCRIRIFSGGDASISAPNSIVHINDKPTKALPVNIKQTEEAVS